MKRGIGAVWLAIALVVPLAVPAAAQSSPASGWTIVAQGLDSPRGLEFGPDGTLYVALAGAGGDQCAEGQGPEGPTQICTGTTGGVSAVDTATGAVTPVVTGLPSAATPTEVLGPADVAIAEDGTVYLLTADGNVPDAAERAEGDIGGIVWKAGADGTPEQVADLVAYEAASNPDQGEVDANPNGIVVTPDGNLLVADAGANALIMIAADGTISTGAVFESTTAPYPPDPNASPDANATPFIGPMQAVPTSVTLGLDGAAYVGQLNGFPFEPGAAKVWRIEQGAEPTVYAEGFTNIIGLAFGPDGTLYVAEIAHNGLASGDITGGLWAVAPDGSKTQIPTDGLIAVGGVAVAEDGTVYLSTGAVMPGGGSIVSMTPSM
jgi:sugar lactone lactonase YvrE